MATNPGTDSGEGCSNEWFLMEAECSDENDPPEDVPDYDAATDVSDLIDDTEVEEGNTLELFRVQEHKQSQYQVTQLKRKYVPRSREQTKVLCDLSPRLNVLANSPEKTRVKRRHLEQEGDSGVGLSLSFQNEVTTMDENQPETMQVEGAAGNVNAGVVQDVNINLNNNMRTITEDILRSSNRKATLLAKFKTLADVSFTDLTRQFKSDQTCCPEWVIAAFGVPELLFESTKALLRPHCVYMHLKHLAGTAGLLLLMLVEFKTAKNRGTVRKLLQGILGISELLVLAEPPRRRSVPVALYWYKSGLSGSYIQGETPAWLKQQLTLSHQIGEELSFDFSAMVQWAYDHDLIDESKIAYGYACLADEDKNARAWLASPAQARYVRDCSTMVRHYKRAEMLNMSMSEWIHRRIQQVSKLGDWRDIVNFLRYQHIEFIPFLNTLKTFLKGIPKRNCILIHGPPNTGKSYFCMTLIRFLAGNIISYVNSKSQFWLQPITDAKVVLLDDATGPCWNYFDTYLRNLLDGNPICVDRKHRAPVQTKCPPLLVTSNIDIKTNDCWRYLYSRIACYKFVNDMPFKPDGSPEFALTDESWASFFKRLWTHLELSDQEDEGDDGDSTQAFRCGSRRTDESV
ncbi:E1 [Trichechus manatus papillomavirus]|nr:E1 [Trichechus manatus papillomavirus]